MTHDLGLGRIITTPQNRDAIHIAVAPVEAGQDLRAGQHVRLSDGGVAMLRTSAYQAETVGIVDPYLKVAVCKGQMFWLFLYPNTITALAHHWTHPAFEEVEKRDHLTMARELDQAVQMVQSVKWLKDFAVDRAELSYEELMEGAHNYLKHGEYLCDGGKWEGFVLPKEFWEHYEKATGDKVKDDDKYSFFSCSC